MPITLHIEAADAADLVAQLQHLLQVAGQPSPPQLPTFQPTTAAAATESIVEPAAVEETSPKTRTNGSRSAKPPTASKSPAKPKSEPAAKSDSPKPKPLALTRADVRKALTAHLAAHDEEVTGALLKKYGQVDRLSELAEENFQAVYDAATAAA